MRIRLSMGDVVSILNDNGVPIMDISYIGLFCGWQCELKGVDEI